VGSVVEGIITGSGVMEYPGLGTYEGSWKSAVKDGHGIFLYVNGELLYVNGELLVCIQY